MSAYDDAATLAQNASFQAKVKAALFAGCARIGTGSFITDNQKNHFMAMMMHVVDDPEKYVTVFAWSLAAECGITAASLDSDIDAAINSLWPAISGYLNSQG